MACSLSLRAHMVRHACRGTLASIKIIVKSLSHLMARVGGVDVTVLYYYLCRLQCDWTALVCGGGRIRQRIVNVVSGIEDIQIVLSLWSPTG